MKKLLLTGASGFLGWNICRICRKNWTIYGTVFLHKIDIKGVNIIQADLTDVNRLKKLFKDIQPDAVIHTAAKTDPNYCQKNKTETHKINVDVSLNIADLCADFNIPCVFTSTDLVFNGLDAPYTEEDSVSPVNFYGEQKALAEEGMLLRYPETAVCRMPLMFGNTGEVSSSFIQPMVKAMKEGSDLRLFIDEFRTPASANTAVQGLLLAIEKVNGIIHLGGKERISRYDFGLCLKEICGLKNAKILPCKQKDVPMAAPRSPDVSFDSSKAFAKGFNPLPLTEEFKMINL